MKKYSVLRLLTLPSMSSLIWYVVVSLCETANQTSWNRTVRCKMPCSPDGCAYAINLAGLLDPLAYTVRLAPSFHRTPNTCACMHSCDVVCANRPLGLSPTKERRVALLQTCTIARCMTRLMYLFIYCLVSFCNTQCSFVNLVQIVSCLNDCITIVCVLFVHPIVPVQWSGNAWCSNHCCSFSNQFSYVLWCAVKAMNLFW